MIFRSTAALAGILIAAAGAHAAGLQAGSPGFPGTPAPHLASHGMACAAIQASVARHGHAVVTFARSSWWAGYGTDRIVKDQRYCLHGEATTPIWVQARDTAQCFAGYTCSEGGESGSRRSGR